jgi:hypothetical protein
MATPVIIYTIEQYTILSDAIASGALKVHYGDKTVEYRSLDDMLRIQKIMCDQLFPSQNKNNGRVYSAFSKGTGCSHRNRY